jgi:hypothetical protein
MGIWWEAQDLLQTKAPNRWPVGRCDSPAERYFHLQVPDLWEHEKFWDVFTAYEMEALTRVLPRMCARL